MASFDIGWGHAKPIGAFLLYCASITLLGKPPYDPREYCPEGPGKYRVFGTGFRFPDIVGVLQTVAQYWERAIVLLC